MSSLDSEIARLAAQQDQDALRRYLKAERYKEAYAHAVVHVCGDNAEMSKLIFAHTNAFFIRRDEALRKGPDKDKPFIVCEVYIDDPVVRSEVDMRQELIRLALAYDKIHINEFRIIPSRGNMRKRHPFARYATDTVERKGLERSSVSHERTSRLRRTEEDDDLETVKRAFCLVFGIDAEDVLNKICAAKIETVPTEDVDDPTRSDPYKRLNLYSEDASDLKKVVRGFSQSIVARARELGLRLQSIAVYDAKESMQGRHAFPTCGKPVLFDDVEESQEL